MDRIREIREILLPLIADRERRERAVARICQLFEPKPNEKLSSYLLPSSTYDKRFILPDESKLLSFAEDIIGGGTGSPYSQDRMKKED